MIRISPVTQNRTENPNYGVRMAGYTPNWGQVQVRFDKFNCLMSVGVLRKISEVIIRYGFSVITSYLITKPTGSPGLWLRLVCAQYTKQRLWFSDCKKYIPTTPYRIICLVQKGHCNCIGM